MVWYFARHIFTDGITLSFSVMNSNMTDIILGAVTQILALKNSSVAIMATTSKSSTEL